MGIIAGIAGALIGRRSLATGVKYLVEKGLKDEAKGYIAYRATRRAVGGALVGGALWGATGNASWMPLMIGAFGWGGGARGIKAMDSTAFEGAGRIGRYLASSRAARNFAIGSAIGIATNNPRWSIYGMAGLPAAKWLLKTSFSPSGGLRMVKGLLQAPFAPRAAVETFRSISGVQAGGAGGFMGLVIGGAYAANKFVNWKEPNSVTSGYFPGGIMPLAPGGRGISHNHLNTEGLTLALHQNSRSRRIV